MSDAKAIWLGRPGHPVERPLDLDIAGVLEVEAMRTGMDELSECTSIISSDALRKLDPSAELKRLAIDVDAAKHDAVSASIRELAKATNCCISRV